MVGREGLENRRIVWITSQGSVRPHSSDGNRKPRGSIRAVLRANEGEGGHMGRGRVTEEEFVEQGGGWEFSCSRTAKQGRRREKLKRVRKSHGWAPHSLGFAAKTHELTGSRKLDARWRNRRTARVVGGKRRA